MWIRWLILLVSVLPLWGEIERKHYSFSMEPIDVVIPCAPKDLRSLEACIRGIRENGTDVRRVIVISKEKLTDSAEWFSEELFPFSKEAIAFEVFKGDAERARAFVEMPDSRIGWIYQQFLKFYAPFVIPAISPNVLILDADVIFLNRTAFRTRAGTPLFTSSDEPFHAPYFSHAARVLDGLKRVHANHSGIAHHMLFQRPILEDLFELIQKQHGIEPWRAIARAVDVKDVHFASMSEYEIYFNFALLRTQQAAVRALKWTLIHSLRLTPGFKSAAYSFVCYPTWLAP